MPVEIIRDAIPAAMVRAASASWPAWDWPFWHKYHGATADKFGTMDRCRIPPACLAALDALAMAVVPHIGESFIDYDLHAAGMHMMWGGGFLGRHLDAECHPVRLWRRTHSVVLFVNPEWQACWGGILRLETACGVIEIPPEPGTAVIFNTADQWHEVTPVNHSCPKSRKTLALFAWREGVCEGSTSATFRMKGPS